MSFYKGKLQQIDFTKMQEYMGEQYLIASCKNGKSSKLEFNKNEKDFIIKSLEKYNEIYCIFGKREGKNLVCINDKNYMIDDDRTNDSKGVYMADAYFNEYDDINLGFLLSYKDEILDIKPAIEGKSTLGRSYEVIENCGDLYDEMKSFVEKFII